MFLCCIKYTEEKKGPDLHIYYFIMCVAFIKEKNHEVISPPILLTSEHSSQPLRFDVFFLDVCCEIAQ